MESTTQKSNTEQKQHPAIAMGYLYSPPDMPLGDSFSSDHSNQDRTVYSPFDKMASMPTKLPPMQQAPSPPTSPAASTLPSFRSVTEAASVDAPLYPRRGSLESTRPLFPSDDESTRLHVPLSRPAFSQPPRPTLHEPNFTARPSASDRELVQSFAKQMRASYEKDPYAYYNARLRELWQMRSVMKSKPRSPLAASRPQKRAQSNGNHKRQWYLETKIMTTTTKAPRLRRAPPMKNLPYSDTLSQIYHAPTPEPKPKPKRASPSKLPNLKDDTNYNALPDYTPDVSTLSESGRTLKASWKGQPLDLSDDPDRVACHESEVTIAQVLRLSCASYLTTKRRIFEARVHCLRDGKNFSKTQAQLVCKIDVNKASRLHEAFERVGWFDEKHFGRYLQ